MGEYNYKSITEQVKNLLEAREEDFESSNGFFLIRSEEADTRLSLIVDTELPRLIFASRICPEKKDGSYEDLIYAVNIVNELADLGKFIVESDGTELCLQYLNYFILPDSELNEEAFSFAFEVSSAEVFLFMPQLEEIYLGSRTVSELTEETGDD